MNQYPLWKNLLVAVVLLVGCFYALPNLFGVDPAVQVSSERGSGVTPDEQSRMLDRLTQLGLSPVRTDFIENRLLYRFANEEQQLRARDALKEELGRDYVVALNLASSSPQWLGDLGALPMYLGLDLRGGIHFLIQVDMEGAIRQAEERFVSDFSSLLRDEGTRFKSITRRESGGMSIRFVNAEAREAGAKAIRRDTSDLDFTEADGDNGEALLRLTLTEAAGRNVKTNALQQNITTLRNRVNEIGVAEPIIQQQGEDRIVVQLPGIQDSARAKRLLGGTATLEFRMVDTEHSAIEAQAGRVPATAKLFFDGDGRPVLLRRNVMLTGEYIINAAATIDSQSGSPAVSITLDGRGAKLMARRTRDKIGLPMGTVFIEKKSDTRLVDGKEIVDRWDEERVINVATIRDQLGKNFQITGLDSSAEANNLALFLRAGALAAPIEIVEERTVGPTLGRESIDKGFRSVIIGFVLVLLFMAFYYKTFGLVANLALTVNLVMIVAVLSMLQATLTLPGIAGIVLTVGMAVDANVLIFERIREEVRNGNTPQASIHAGYEKAVSTIADANITTLIAALVLFGFGSGPIKGFAITLSIGIATSMFTAIIGTRSVINFLYGGKRVEKLLI